MQQLYEAQKGPTLLIIRCKISFSSSNNVSTLHKKLKAIPNVYDSKVSALWIVSLCFKSTFCCFIMFLIELWISSWYIVVFIPFACTQPRPHFFNLISYKSLVLLDERYHTHKHDLLEVYNTHAILLFSMLFRIWQYRDANGLSILRKWCN